MANKPAKKKLLDKVGDKTTKIAGLVSAFLVITGAITGAVSWVSGQFTSAVSSQIDEFRKEVVASDQTQNQAITRLELTNLIKNDPYNVVAIEKMARYYFIELDGDQYMTSMYSEWAREYGGDMTIVIGGQ